MKRVALIVLACLALAAVPPTAGGRTQTIPAETYRVYLPGIKSAPNPRGLAMAHDEYPADRALLGVGWWYDWTSAHVGAVGYVPMTWCGSLPANLPPTYSGPLLAFNEPNVVSQCNITPAQTVERYAALLARYPQADIIPAGTSAWANDWLTQFVGLVRSRGLRYPRAFHVHAYVEEWLTLEVVKGKLAEAQRITGTPLWVTEYNVIPANPGTFAALTDWLSRQDWIERYAAYTNRQAGEVWALPGADLVRPDGQLTESGARYAYPAP